jgi:hypothetical protein
MDHCMLWQGKYQGRSFVQIEARDKSYCSWVLRTTTLPLSLKLFQRFLVEKHGGLFTVGKHEGLWFGEVADSDPAYAEWGAKQPLGP